MRLIAILLVLASLFGSIHPHFPDISRLASWVLARRDALVMGAYGGQYAVMRRGMDRAFGSSSRLYSVLNGYSILSVSQDTATVLLDVADWFLWDGGRSAAGDVVILRMRRFLGVWFPVGVEWWVDLREYQLDRFSPDEIVEWNKRFLPYLMLTPSVRLVDATAVDVQCNETGAYDGRIAAMFMLSHTYPVGSFTWGLRWESPAYPGDDCANSVSYALMCGGMRVDDVWRPGEAAWIYVPALWMYLRSRGWKRVPCEDADVGDVLLFDVNRSGVPEHATLITDKMGGVPLYTGHTSQKVNMPVPEGPLWMCYHHP